VPSVWVAERETTGYVTNNVASFKQVTFFRDLIDPSDPKSSKGLQVHVIIDVVDRHGLSGQIITQITD
jgi:hypothetical protein